MRIVSLPAVGLTTIIVAALTLGAHAQNKDTTYRPTATIKEIMDSMVAPNAQKLWDSTGVEVTESGTIDHSPKTDDDWMQLRFAAVTLAEATNSLAIPGRGVTPDVNEAVEQGNLAPKQIAERIANNRGDWVAHAHALNDAVMAALKAIDAHDVDGLSNAGGDLDEACENCHLEFWYPPAKK